MMYTETTKRSDILDTNHMILIIIKKFKITVLCSTEVCKTQVFLQEL
jgi:hypothetical protein